MKRLDFQWASYGLHWLALCGMLFWLSGCNPSQSDTIDPAPPSTTVTTPQTVTASGSLTDILSKTEHLSLLNSAIVRAGLADKLKTGTFTLLAPTDEAFKTAGYVSKAMLDSVPVSQLQRLLQYHLLTNRLSASSLPAGVPTSLQTDLVTASVSLFKAANGQLFANAARIVQPDIGADKSVMYVVDKLLVIPDRTTIDLVRGTPDLSMFRLAIERVGGSVAAVLLSPTDRGITVLAPSNAAFRAAGFNNEDAILAADLPRLTEIVRYHILTSRAFTPTLSAGDLITVQGTAVGIAISPQGVTITGKGNPAVAGNLLQTDLITTNGVVHVLDRVLLPTPIAP